MALWRTTLAPACRVHVNRYGSLARQTNCAAEETALYQELTPASVVRIDFRRYVAIADVRFVDLFELLNRVVRLVHLLENVAELVEHLLLLVIEVQFFLERFLNLACRQVIHAAFGEA